VGAADQRLLTGSPDFDLILGGGLPRGSTTVIAGPPGSGKTVFAQQIAFANATRETPVLYYTTWSEPHTKLLRNLRDFEFFDEMAIGQRIEILHLPAISDDAGGPDFEQVSRELFRASVERQPAIVVIDSSKALHGLVPDDRLRRVFYELASRVGQTNTALLLVGEYTADEIEREPEFAVADGILQFANEPRGLSDKRWVRVVKMRGSANLPGQHSLTISRRGIQAYPRLETLVPSERPVGEGRARLGDDGLDVLTGGGLPRGDGTLVLGPAGIGKTVLSLGYVAEGLRLNEPALFLSFQETSQELKAKAAALGWKEIEEAVDAGRLRIRHVRPVDLELDQVGVVLRDELLDLKPKRVVIDSIAELNLGARKPDRYLSYLWALVHLVTGYGATGIFTQETATLGPQVSQELLSFVFQNVLTMRFVEHGHRLSRAVGAFKMRESSHDTDLMEFTIGPQGLKTLRKMEGVSGLLGWTALRKET
jgi:circadian clock protein KaiC